MIQADSVHSTPPINTSAIEHPQSPDKPLGEARDALFRRTDISPEQFFRARPSAWKAAADEIERLIQWLDSTIDVDEDEASDDVPCDGEGDDEPSLGSFDRLSNQLHGWKTRGWGDVDAESDRCDDEDADPVEGKLQPLSLNREVGNV